MFSVNIVNIHGKADRQGATGPVQPVSTILLSWAVETGGHARGRSMVASDGFAEFLREQLASLGRIALRRMFGKTGVFCDGVMLGMVTEDTLYLRVDDENRAVFEEAASAPPLNYRKQGQTIDLSFWRTPERLLDEPDELLEWARIALAAARRVAAERNRTAPKRQSKRQRK
jgi:DNA transformation protein and related proteins